MPTSEESTAALLRERYGTDRSGQRRILVAGTVLLAIGFLAWLGWTAWHHSTPGIRGGLVSFTIDSERQATARIDVRLDAGTSGRCLLRATASDHFVVGEVNARVHESGTHRVQVRTERRATAVELVDCTLEPPR